MGAMSHSAEPWKVEEPSTPDPSDPAGRPGRFYRIGNEAGNTIIMPWLYSEPEGDNGLGAAYGIRRADADRIVACVNACRGIPTADLQKLRLVKAVDALNGIDAIGANIDCEGYCGISLTLQEMRVQ